MKPTSSSQVSVIIPTYNRAEMVGEAIESVLNQDFSSFELIVIDDGSTDQTSKVLRSFGRRIRSIRQENKGVSAARNLGICHASGEWIAFLDSDDLWLPGKLTAQVDFFRRNPASLICQTQEIWIRNGRRVNPKHRHEKRSGMIFEPSLALCLVSPSAVMIRRSLFDLVGRFDENLPACEDYDLWLRIGRRFPVHLIDRPLIVKRGGHEDQLSQTPGLDKFRIASLQNLIDSGTLDSDQERAARRMLQKKCRIYANGCRKRNRIPEADYFQTLGERYGMAVAGRESTTLNGG
ncbi:MAG: glycosyltransferase family 2 protein [Thermodesulfobacteriota bacterium]